MAQTTNQQPHPQQQPMQPGQQPQPQPAQPGQQPATPPHEAQHADPVRGQQTIQTSHDQPQPPKSVEERLAAIEANLERLIPLIGSTTQPAQPHMTQQPQVQPAAGPHTGGQR